MIGPHRDELTTTEKHLIRRWVKQTGDRLIAGLQVIIAVGGLAAVLLVSVPWLKSPLDKLGLSSSVGFTQSVLAVILVSIFFDVRRITNRGKGDPSHFSDPMAVFPVLFKRIENVTRQEQKVIDVLGLSLHISWPGVKFWLNRPQLNGWTVRLTAMVDDGGRLDGHVPSSSMRDARANLNSIVEYGESSDAALNNVTVQAFSYDFMPSLHGYRLGNGDIFYSILRWQDDGRLNLDNYSYEFIPHEDTSPSADAMRSVFNSWFERATRDPWNVKRPLLTRGRRWFSRVAFGGKGNRHPRGGAPGRGCR